MRTLREAYLQEELHNDPLHHKIKSLEDERLDYFVRVVLEALKDIGKEDISVQEFINLDFCIELARESKSQKLYDFIYNIPTVNEDLSYDMKAKELFAFLVMKIHCFGNRPSRKILKENEKLFIFDNNVKNLNIDMNYQGQILSGNIEFLMKVKDFVVENDLTGKIDYLKIIEQVNMIGY